MTSRTEGHTGTLAAGGDLVVVGAAPKSGWLSDLGALDDRGIFVTGAEAAARSPCQTSVPGIFARGGVRAGSVKPVASAVGDGAVVVASVWTHCPQSAERP